MRMFVIKPKTHAAVTEFIFVDLEIRKLRFWILYFFAAVEMTIERLSERPKRFTRRLAKRGYTRFDEIPRYPAILLVDNSTPAGGSDFIA